MNSRQSTGALLLAGGIAIGIGLTVISMNAFSSSQKAQNGGPGQVMAAQEGQMVADASTQPAEQATATPPVASQPAPAAQAQAPAAPPQPQAYNPFVQSGQAPAPSAIPQQAALPYPPSVSYTMVPAGPPVTREMSTTISGYPIEVSNPTRAVDAPDAMVMPIGRNGMQSNPCVDPPSVTAGRAYNAPQ